MSFLLGIRKVYGTAVKVLHLVTKFQTLIRTLSVRYLTSAETNMQKYKDIIETILLKATLTTIAADKAPICLSLILYHLQ